MNKDRVVNHLDEKGGKNKQPNGKSKSKNTDNPSVNLNGEANNNKKDATPVKEPDTANTDTSNNVGTDVNNNGSDTNKNDISNNQSSDNVTDNTDGKEVENTSDNQEKNKNNSDTKSSDKDSLNNGDFNEYELPNDAWNKQIKFFTSNPALLWFGGKADGIASFIGDVATLGLLSRKTIKGRFRKTVKTLYKLQKDFGGSEKGLDMNDAFKGQGSRLMDMLMRVFFVGNKYSSKGGTGAIGIIPLVNNYRNELKRDFVDAVKTYNMIATAGKQPKDLGAIKDSYVPEYKSFTEAYKARMLNESAYQREDLYETLTDFIAEANTAKINYSAGKYVMYTRDKDGNLKPSQSVQVTPESTREICYSIMNIFFSKYFNMKNVSKKFGIDVNSLSDIDKSNVDKFTKVIKSLKTEQSDNNIASKMFARVENRYKSIVSSYKVIAKKVIENFDKYSRLNKDGETKALSEKDDNLLTSATTKLYEKLKEQIDIYGNNFYRVVNAIIATPEYTKYMKFIIDTVIPVFTTGNAGDADFILDTLPKVGEFFIVRQTRDKNVSNTSISVDGTAALVKILSIDNKGNNSKSPIVQIQRVGLFKPVEGHEGGQIAINNNGSVDYKSIDFKTSVILDRTAFSREVNDNSGDTQTVPYNKWLAIDPVPVTNYSEAGENTETKNDNDTVTLERNLDDGSAEYVFIIPNGTNDSSDINVPKAGNEEVVSKEFEPDAVMNEDKNTENKTVKTIRVLIKDNQSRTQGAIDIKPTQDIGINDIIGILNNSNFTIIEPDKAEAIKAEAKKMNVNNTQQANNENKVIEIINKKEFITNAGNENNNSTKEKVAEALTEKLDTIAGNIIEACKANSEYKLTRKIDNNSNEYTYSRTCVIPTGVTTTKNNKIAVYVTGNLSGIIPNIENKNKIINALNNNEATLAIIYNKPDISVGEDGKVYIYNTNLKISFYFVKLVNGKVTTDNESTKENTVMVGGTDDKTLLENIKKGLEGLIEIYKSDSDKSTINENKEDVLESIKLEYTHSTVNESMTAVKLVRNAVFESNKNAYLVSMTCWGDGSRINPAKFLEESVKSVVHDATSYSDIANAAKKDKNLNILPLTESVTYQVPMPYNRYAILTNGNPLYEAVAVVTIDATPDHNITSSKFIGVTRIVK